MIDSHAHLIGDMLDAKHIINNMQQDNLELIINIGTSLQDCQEGIKLAQNNKNIYTTVGLHPEYAQELTKDSLKQLENFLPNNKIVAIGEIGLDYHYGADDKLKEKQKEYFIEQIKLANKYNLPIVIHCRDAVIDVLSILKQYKHLLANGLCMHCYSEGAQYIQDFINLGAYISFTGNITYKKTDRTYLKQIPLDKLMVETDCPFLSPEPIRGTINQPKNVTHIIQKIADTLQMDYTELEKITSNNSKTFFKIK